MGKLHKIRKAVEQNPQVWIVETVLNGDTALGASIDSNGEPRVEVYLSDIYHRRYVRSILRKLGYDVK